MTWKFKLRVLSRAESLSKISFFVKNSFDDITLKFALPLLSRAEIFEKASSFDDVTWKIELSLLSAAMLGNSEMDLDLSHLR